MKRPELTLPEAEAEAVTAAYRAAGVILEYGSGGSTVLAAEMPGKRVFSVESDADWARGMAAWFARSPPLSAVVIHAVDIGPTGPWGKPLDRSGRARWPDYPQSVWARADFAHPDVVLVDGRFRAACLLAVAERITRPVTLLFDDYVGRRYAALVEPRFRPEALIGRMARFQLSPRRAGLADRQRFRLACRDPL